MSQNSPQEGDARDIFWAATYGDLPLLKKFIESDKIDVNIRGNEGVTPLHWAAYKNKLDCVKYLLDNGAEIDPPNLSEGHTPLMWACIEGHIQTVHYLLEQGADINKIDQRGYNALHHAVQYNQVLVAHFLLSKGLYVDGKDNEGHTPLMWASYMDFEEAIRYLLAQGSDIHATDNGGLTALHWAALKGKLKAAKALIDAGSPDVLKKDNDGETPAQMAQRKGFVKVAQSLKSAERFSGQPKLNVKQATVLWFVVAFLGINCALLLFAKFPSFILSFVIVIAAIYALKFMLSHLWLDTNHRNPLWSGVVFGAYALSVFAYFTQVFYVTNYHSLETLIFFCVNFAFGPLYLYLLNADPGYVKPEPNEWQSYLGMLERGEPLPQFCLTCMCRRPIRSKHCRSCGHCVARFDHHCGWINNCVGVDNNAPFLLELILVVTNHILFVKFCTETLFAYPEAPTVLPLNVSIPFYYEHEPLIMVLLFFHVSNLGWQSWLVYGLVSGIYKNITTNEMLNGHRYDYLKHPITGKFFNPFNLGFVKNLMDIIPPHAYDWHRLYFVPRQLLPSAV
jgi:palmitoyltransferase